MSTAANAENQPNILQTVPFFRGSNMDASLKFYDPDGYRLEFASPTDVPEGTEYAKWKK